MRRRFSSPVRRESTAENCPVTPITPRTASGSRATSWPATRTSPPSAPINVDRICTVVVLPAPLGPSSAKIEPSATFRSMPSSATFSPNDLRRPVAFSAGRTIVVVMPPPFVAAFAKERRTMMSPQEVRARTSTGSSPGSGGPEASRSFCTLPNRVLRSSQAATPSRTPTSTVPAAVSATTAPRATSPRRTSPFAVFAVTAASAWSTEILPLAAFTRRSPVTSPIRVSPLEFLTTAAPSMLPITKAPEPVVIWLSPAARFTLISPAPLLSCTGPAWSSWMSPRPTL